MGTAWAAEEGVNFRGISAGSEAILEGGDGCESGAPALAVRGRAAFPSGLGNEESAHAAELLPPPHPQHFLPFFCPFFAERNLFVPRAGNRPYKNHALATILVRQRVFNVINSVQQTPGQHSKGLLHCGCSNSIGL